jgi:hypothetical protein
VYSRNEIDALVCDSERRVRSPGKVEVVGFEAVAEGELGRIVFEQALGEFGPAQGFR